MRRKPSSNNNYNNNQHRNKPRYQGSGQQGGHNRPRKNYTALREKYLNQARDALASGDRVLAENWFQHADHCYRMMLEEGYNPNPRPQHVQPQDGQQPDAQVADENAQAIVEDISQESANSNALPAFITGGYEQKPVDPNTVQNWEERDA